MNICIYIYIFEYIYKRINIDITSNLNHHNDINPNIHHSRVCICSLTYNIQCEFVHSDMSGHCVECCWPSNVVCLLMAIVHVCSQNNAVDTKRKISQNGGATLSRTLVLTRLVTKTMSSHNVLIHTEHIDLTFL